MTVGRAPGLAPGHSICPSVCMCENACVCVYVTAARLDPLTRRHSGSVPDGTSRHTHTDATHPIRARQEQRSITRLLRRLNACTHHGWVLILKTYLDCLKCFQFMNYQILSVRFPDLVQKLANFRLSHIHTENFGPDSLVLNKTSG